MPWHDGRNGPNPRFTVIIIISLCDSWIAELLACSLVASLESNGIDGMWVAPAAVTSWRTSIFRVTHALAQDWKCPVTAIIRPNPHSPEHTIAYEVVTAMETAICAVGTHMRQARHATSALV